VGTWSSLEKQLFCVQVLEFDPLTISRLRGRPGGESETFSVLDSTTPSTKPGRFFKDEITTSLPCVESKWVTKMTGAVRDLKLYEDGFVVSTLHSPHEVFGL